VSHQNDVVWYLKIEHDETEGVRVLTATGRVSSLTVAELEKALGAGGVGPIRGLVLDLSGVDYISSQGIRVLASTATALAEAGRPFVVCGVRDPVGVAFALAGLEPTLAIEPSREAALARAISSLRADERAC
jgi:anti-anti-sigma factor